MGHIITDLKEAFRRGNVYIQLIFINVGVFVITTLIGILLQLFNRSAAGIFELLALPASFTRFAWQPWSIFTYMFMHAGFLHILFNMLWLYWFGALFLYFFSGKHLRGLYIVGGICGGLLYMISYNVFPYFRPMTAYSTMVGASASVLAIVVATAYREPNYPVRLLFFGNVRLKYLALIVVLTDLLFITSSNAGGHIAHLGGALAGLWFAASLNKGKDITSWVNKALDAIAALFSAKTWKRKPKMKVHYGNNTRQNDYDYNARKKAQSDEIDRILDKLKKSGYESSDNRRKKELVRRKQKIAHEAYRQISPILMSGCQRILHRNVTVDSLQPVYQSRSASGAVMPGTDFSHFSRHQLLLSDLLAHRALPFRTGTPTGIPPLLSAVAHLYACQPGNGRTTGKQHQTPFVQHHVLWEHEERERTKPHPELYKKQQRRHRLHAGVCRLRNRQDTSQQ